MRLPLILALLQVIPCVPAPAQQTPAALGSWSHVQQLPIHSNIRIKGDKKTYSCLLDSVSEDQLACSHSQSANSQHYEISRAEIQKIKLARRGHSAVVGLALGAAIGAGAGAGLGAAINSGDHSYLHASGGKAAGVGAVLGVVILGSVGALVAYSEDFFAGPVVYQR